MIDASRPNAMASVKKSSPILRYLINQVPRQKMLNYSCNWCTDLKKGLSKFNPQDSHALKCVIIEIFRESAYTE